MTDPTLRPASPSLLDPVNSPAGGTPSLISLSAALVEDSDALQQKRSDLLPRTFVQVIDKKVWGEELFHFIKDKKAFNQCVEQNTVPMYKTKAIRCGECLGKGYIQKISCI